MTHKLILMQKKNIMYHILDILFISMELPNWMEWKTQPRGRVPGFTGQPGSIQKNLKKYLKF